MFDRDTAICLSNQLCDTKFTHDLYKCLIGPYFLSLNIVLTLLDVCCKPALMMQSWYRHELYKLFLIAESTPKGSSESLDILADLPQMPVQKLEHLNKARPRRAKTRAATRPVAPGTHIVNMDHMIWFFFVIICLVSVCCCRCCCTFFIYLACLSTLCTSSFMHVGSCMMMMMIIIIIIIIMIIIIVIVVIIITFLSCFSILNMLSCAEQYKWNTHTHTHMHTHTHNTHIKSEHKCPWLEHSAFPVPPPQTHVSVSLHTNNPCPGQSQTATSVNPDVHHDRNRHVLDWAAAMPVQVLDQLCWPPPNPSFWSSLPARCCACVSGSLGSAMSKGVVVPPLRELLVPGVRECLWCKRQLLQEGEVLFAQITHPPVPFWHRVVVSVVIRHPQLSQHRLVIVSSHCSCLSAVCRLWPPHWTSGRASASRAEDPMFEFRLRRDFFRVESYQWLKNWHSSGYPARRQVL